MIKIKGRKIGLGHPCFFIAEVGINHNGSLKMALELVRKAVEVGAEAVKFQKRTIPVVYNTEELDKPREFDESIINNALERQEIEGVHYQVLPEENLRRLKEGGPRTNGDLKYALEFGQKEFDIINQLCLELGVTWSASCWDGLSAHFINGFDDVEWLKIASPCLTNRDLLERTRAKGKPILLSTGGSTVEQVRQAVEIIGTDNLVLMHCVAAYPPRDEDTNLLVMETLRRIYPMVPVGYSSHHGDTFAAEIAAVLGACCIEAHLTLDQSLPGSDHKASLNPEQFAGMVQRVRRMETLRGDGIKRVYPAEIKTMEKLRRVTDF